MNLQDLSFDKSWTLFLDRDGVINRRIVGGYVTHWNEFEFLDGALEAIRLLSGIFGKIIVVSNQQGVGKGLMSADQVHQVHRQMMAEIEKAGGRIDRVFFSPHLHDEQHPDRKPGTGMAIKAQQQFPEIQFSRSLMAGDSLSDMQFGKNAGMYTAYIGHENQSEEELARYCDFIFTCLSDLATALAKGNKL